MTGKRFVILICGQEKLINIDRLKVDFLLSDEKLLNSSASITRSGRKVHSRLPRVVRD